ncbi:DMT family transporter [Phaeobacter sp. A36a-5a]|uniref:DMT family transporter n=1 Tax=Phaeobacter bryozoorum TaxID=1086632 RepID=UPI003A858133
MTKAILLVSLGLLWATRLSAIKSAGLSGIPVHVVVGVSIIGIAILFTAVALMRGNWPSLSKATTIFYILSGVFGFIFPFTLEILVAPHLPVFVLIVIIATMPIVTLAISAVVGHEALSKNAVSAVLLGFIGALFLIWDTVQPSQTGRADMIWIAIALGVPVLYAANTVFVATKWPVAADAIQVAHAQALIFSLAVLAGGLTMGGLSIWIEASLNPPAMALIILCEGGALMLYLKIARDHGAIYVSFANYISMFFAAIIGACTFGDQLTWFSALAAAAIIGSVVLFQGKADWLIRR